MIPDVLHRRVRVNGLSLHLAEAGPTKGAPVVLLHGFPEFWYGWRHQIPALAQAGLRVLAPDGRGYNVSDRPKAVASYRMEQLRGDILGLLNAFNIEKTAIAGHDWGAAVAWSMALHHPDRVRRLAILNVPHPAVWPNLLRSRPAQLMRSWYILFFQLPLLPEWVLGLRDGQSLVRSMRRTSAPGAFTKEDLLRYRQAWRGGALTTMIHWYRAALRYPQRAPESRQVQVPVRILWGMKDAFLVPEGAELSMEYCPQGELIKLPHASHWIQHEASDLVNQRLIEFCR
ncbi:MAG: alpha/beta fold hydrolase [Anaerolineales bacterium]